jgi:hypothetical protein
VVEQVLVVHRSLFPKDQIWVLFHLRNNPNEFPRIHRLQVGTVPEVQVMVVCKLKIEVTPQLLQE